MALLFLTSLFILWLRCIFIATHSFTLVAASGVTLCCGAWASHRSEFYCCDAQGSAVAAHGLSCSTACGIFLDQWWNLCPLYCRRILNHWRTREVHQEILYQRQAYTQPWSTWGMVTPPEEVVVFPFQLLN